MRRPPCRDESGPEFAKIEGENDPPLEIPHLVGWVEEIEEGEWRRSTNTEPIRQAAAEMINADLVRARLPRRVVAGDGRVVAENALAARHVPLPPYWIVQSIDKPGPRERHGGEFTRHATFREAQNHARALSRRSQGGRYVVLGSLWVTGWFETDVAGERGFATQHPQPNF